MSLSDPIGTTCGHLYTVKSDFGDDYVIIVSKYFGSEQIIYEARTRPEDVLITTGHKSAQSLHDRIEKNRAKELMRKL